MRPQSHKKTRMMKLSLALPSIAFFVLSAASIGAYEMDIGFRKSENTNCSTIMEIICEKDGEYETETLCEAIQLAGLQDDLDTELWTLFAPTDSAFDDLSDAALESLLGGPTMDDTRGLVELLAFHVVPGEGMNSTELTCDARTFMANEEFSVTICEDDRIFQAGVGNPTTNYPEITEANIEACNGVIHLIEYVCIRACFLSWPYHNTQCFLDCFGLLFSSCNHLALLASPLTHVLHHIVLIVLFEQSSELLL
mmetsp:Transcript_108148/g.220829  ORF Transcript_108148/g.220829 Transcript_108148/m.220829 type:complete len:253 (-) Transcript_108148:146-904(-)